MDNSIERTFQTHRSRGVVYTFGLVVLFFCLTPWASWGTNGFDSQPWPFIFCILYLLLQIQRINTPRIYSSIFILMILSICIAMISSRSDGIQNARAIVSYLTIPLVLIFFHAFTRRFGFPIYTIRLVNCIWIFFGILEYVNPVLNSWTSIMRTTEGRGVTSLSPEPTYFAVYLIFSTWVLLVSSNYRPTKSSFVLILLNIISILVLAKSTMGVLFLGPVLLVWYIGRYGFTKGLGVFSAFIVLAVVILTFANEIIFYLFRETRMGDLLYLVDRVGIFGVILSDASINIRLEHVVIPVHAFFESSFLPNGFSGYDEVSRSILHNYRGVFWYPSESDKVMSWTGAFLFEMGFMGLVLVWMLVYSCWNGRTIRAVELMCLLILLVAAIPLAFSVVSILLVTLRLAEMPQTVKINSLDQRYKARNRIPLRHIPRSTE